MLDFRTCLLYNVNDVFNDVSCHSQHFDEGNEANDSFVNSIQGYNGIRGEVGHPPLGRKQWNMSGWRSLARILYPVLFNHDVL